MKVVGRGLSFNDAEVARDVPVDGGAQTLRVELAPQMSARHLRLGVHARVRPPRAVHDDLAALDQRERARQLALHRALALLSLPAVKVRPVVLNCQAVVHKK